MFTGIIEAVGEIVAAEPRGGDIRLRVKSNGLDLGDVALGDSIATNGVCLTVIDLPGDGYWADVSVETIDNTTVASWQVGQAVNLEKALTPQTRLGGHIVSGHVDGVGEVISRHSDARSERFRLRAPDNLAKYIAHKGSITVDGTSLTVNAVQGAEFELNIVPHTLDKTVMGQYRSGSKINLEVDVIARYLERLLQGEQAAHAEGSSDLSMAFLQEHGFAGRK
ncbi:riboflavin synthase [uncultured Pseudoteredinibacter sp.]|uniref:riboflavin synthase n=1 Tax=uncultured Pseudoteredinibacter sp. TaxID=1641701 RepID=UPI0026089B5F|nr:riboflavin synthase [uncultured Pseudoteredinibacter sp.]MCV6623022.1 riboflavin synthase [Cellvibrionaceae bacterium]